MCGCHAASPLACQHGLEWSRPGGLGHLQSIWMAWTAWLVIARVLDGKNNMFCAVSACVPTASVIERACCYPEKVKKMAPSAPADANLVPFRPSTNLGPSPPPAAAHYSSPYCEHCPAMPCPALPCLASEPMSARTGASFPCRARRASCLGLVRGDQATQHVHSRCVSVMSLCDPSGHPRFPSPQSSPPARCVAPLQTLDSPEHTGLVPTAQWCQCPELPCAFPPSSRLPARPVRSSRNQSPLQSPSQSLSQPVSQPAS